MENQLKNLLDTERTNLESEADTLREQIETARKQLTNVEARLVHVRALLGQYANGFGGVDARSPGLKTSAGPTATVCDIAVDVLRERDRVTMYYKDLAQEVIRRGGVLNGKTPEATLNARMVRDERFVRPMSKGYYALREDYPTARNVGARKHPKRHGSN